MIKSVPSPTPAPTAIPVPTDQETDNLPPVKSKTVFSLFTIPAQEAGQLRSAAKVISVSINPLKATGATSLLSSLMTARCGDEIIAQSKIELLTKKRENEPDYRPSIVVPADVICAGELAVRLEVFGFEVALGDVYAADVVSIGKAVSFP